MTFLFHLKCMIYSCILNRNCVCVSQEGDVLLVSTSEGDHLFVDAIENRVLTQIPEKKPATCLLINQSATGVYVLSQDKSVSFYQFNNCITPAFMTVCFHGFDLIS